MYGINQWDVRLGNDFAFFMEQVIILIILQKQLMEFSPKYWFKTLKSSRLKYKRVTPQYDTIAQEKDINTIVYRLYSLTYDEVHIVDLQTPISREMYESFNLYTYG